MPIDLSAEITKPAGPKAAKNINASGTPPVLANTPLIDATNFLSVWLPCFSIAIAISNPGIAPTRAEINPRVTLFLNASRYGS